MYDSFPSHTIFVGVYISELGKITKNKTKTKQKTKIQLLNLLKTDLPVTFCVLKPIEEASDIFSFIVSVFR